MSLFVLYFSTKKIYKDVQHHTIIFSKRHYELLNDIFNKKIFVNDPSLYLHRPGATDPSMIQNDSDTFYVLAPVPNNLSNIDWDKKGSEMSKIIINTLQEKIMPDLKKNIVDSFYITPDYFEDELNTYAGSGFGIQPIFTQSAYFRYGNKAKETKGLYFVGASTHPGAGIPGVLSTSKVTEKLIARDYENIK
jgi:phytoene desaturase